MARINLVTKREWSSDLQCSNLHDLRIYFTILFLPLPSLHVFGGCSSSPAHCMESPRPFGFSQHLYPAAEHAYECVAGQLTSTVL